LLGKDVVLKDEKNQDECLILLSLLLLFDVEQAKYLLQFSSASIQQ
jgi:hypothetical protein